MSTDTPSPMPVLASKPDGLHLPERALWPWLVVLAGLAALYLPSFYDLFNGLWMTDQQGHGPMVLALAVWLMWRRRGQWMGADGAAPWPVLGAGIAALAGVLFVLGRSQGILIFEIGSLPLLLVAVMLVLRGPRQLRAVGFALFFMAFMVPLPGAIVDALTQPMKIFVSYMSEMILHAAGYPIARTGVILQVGPYQLLVADACAGLQTLFTLEALGLLYLNVVHHSSLVRNVGLAIFIVPISMTANIIRVMVLTLITYHFGDAAGQGFLHGFAGIVLFLTALMLIIAADTGLRLLSPPVARPGPAA